MKKRIQEIEQSLVTEYGFMTDLKDLTLILGYPNINAIKMADYRGSLPFRLIKKPGRRDKIVPTRLVAEYLASLEQEARL